MEILTYVAPGMVALVFTGLASLIREPELQRFMSVKIAGAGVFCFMK